MYEKQTWTNGDVITQEKLNHMEEGIANADGSDAGCLMVHVYEDGQENAIVDKTYQEIYDAYSSGKFVFAYYGEDINDSEIYLLKYFANDSEEDGYAIFESYDIVNGSIASKGIMIHKDNSVVIDRTIYPFSFTVYINDYRAGQEMSRFAGEILEAVEKIPLVFVAEDNSGASSVYYMYQLISYVPDSYTFVLRDNEGNTKTFIAQSSDEQPKYITGGGGE